MLLVIGLGGNILYRDTFLAIPTNTLLPLQLVHCVKNKI